jgi:hypothetical protein
MVLQQALRVVEQGNPIIVCPFPPLEMTYILQNRVFMCRNMLICRCRILNICRGAHDFAILEQDRIAPRLFPYSFAMNHIGLLCPTNQYHKNLNRLIGQITNHKLSSIRQKE